MRVLLLLVVIGLALACDGPSPDYGPSLEDGMRVSLKVQGNRNFTEVLYSGNMFYNVVSGEKITTTARVWTGSYHARGFWNGENYIEFTNDKELSP